MSSIGYIFAIVIGKLFVNPCIFQKENLVSRYLFSQGVNDERVLMLKRDKTRHKKKRKKYYNCP